MLGLKLNHVRKKGAQVETMTRPDHDIWVAMTCEYLWPGARPTNDISIEFEIRPKLGAL